MSEVIVPIMALGYLLIALVVIVLNINEIPSLIGMIVNEAFNPSSAIGGGIGAVILQGAKEVCFQMKQDLDLLKRSCSCLCRASCSTRYCSIILCIY